MRWPKHSIARIAEDEAREAEADLKRTAEELSTSLEKLSEGASRMAVQRAYALIDKEQAQEGLLWLSRALELAPTGNTPLETEIRTAMSAVAKKLPQPQFVLSPEAGQVYSQFSTSRDGRRILLVTKADRTRISNLLDVRVLDARSGATVSTIEVPPETNWASLGADGHSLYTSDGLQLRRYSAETGVWLGPDFNLTEAFGDPSGNIPPALLEAMEQRQLTSEANVAIWSRDSQSIPTANSGDWPGWQIGTRPQGRAEGETQSRLLRQRTI